MELQRASKYYLVGILAAMAVLPILCHARCNYKAIFNFGDSTSDTGGIHYAFPFNELSENYPYGETYFGKPTGRYGDGRLSIDFFAKGLGLPFLSPYLQSVGSNFGGGANFAAAGATARDEDSFIAPVTLSVQINQFKVFKQQVLASIGAHGPLAYLPSAEAFKQSGIYTIEIGGNDFSYGYMELNLTTAQLKQTILPKVATSVAAAAQALYNEGARNIMVRDLPPQGCGPYWLTFFSHASNDFDPYGCSISFNDAARYYNTLLRAQLSSLRQQLKDANIIYLNTYDIIYDFFANPSKYGFTATTRSCCGAGGVYNDAVWCGKTSKVNGTKLQAVACSNPSSAVSWDGVHWTDEANKLLTQQIFSGKYFEPSFPLASYCDLQPL